MNGTNYYRRVFSAYLTGRNSHLSFWHELPEINVDANPQELGPYYMTFSAKANYPGPFDEQGIPLLDYHGQIGRQYNPIAIAQYGLGNYNLYRRHRDAERRQKFLRVAEWLAGALEKNTAGYAAWHHHFDWEYRTPLRAPWYSGLAQGQGISVLVRAWRDAESTVFRRTADEAFEVFLHDVNEGGVAFRDDAGHLWIEEYVVAPDPPTHILNGFIWAMWGIYDYWLATQDSRAEHLFNESVRTLQDCLPNYDSGYWSLYEQSGTRMKMLASPFYHQLHIVQLQVMTILTGDPRFRDFAKRWEAYSSRSWNRKRAVAHKSAFKLLYY